MRLNTTHFLIVAAVVGAGFAIVHNTSATPASAAVTLATPPDDHAPAALLPQQPGSEHKAALPPNHPPMGQRGGAGAGNHDHAGAAAVGQASTTNDFVPADQAPAVLTWKAPAEWSLLPNPSTMRLATNKVPRVSGDNDDAELSVSRAGGDTDANVQRWVGQFDAAGKERIHTKTVQGFKVTFVEVEGTYAGGMGASNATHKNWALMGAIVETPPQSYFFKVIGPTATVHAARKTFDAMIDGIGARH